ncbi:uncharacterized protein TRAVEDRAFT_48068 [Trametes versicolor FP-101664 SS1]|uniref:uncharacterized protein n=1 Tax=Trametes versicolor (strain FP-101664) TaxID=717944 RepID=UPI00046245A9|nr:uncharacterized protein TRAVEDRAFT_48068 [Trametes versicolor FP-101664 SS1]EIW58925.1 hypothetical protein TRAVEDRAFT_48068 [Trametes versicolor FP-101664 SS1]
MALDPTVGTAKRIYPIPKPMKLADRIRRCAKSGSATLQRQMHFESDPKTFSALMVGCIDSPQQPTHILILPAPQRLIRKTASSYTDLTLPYKWQDPQTLDYIRDEVGCLCIMSTRQNSTPFISYGARVFQVLEQCPTLEGMYVDAWPVYSYLQLAMKYHASPAHRSSIEGESISKCVVRRSGRLRKARSDTCEHDHGEEYEDGDEDEDVSSSGVEKSGDSEYVDADVRSDSDADFEEQNTSLSYNGGDRNSLASDSGASLEDARIPSNAPVIHSPEVELGTSNAVMETGQLRSPSAPESSPTTAAYQSDPGPSNTVQRVKIQDLLRARGFPYSDAQRIALLFGSLGITDETYLRMLAHLPSGYREAWLSEMRQKNLLSDIQSWGIMEMLDAEGSEDEDTPDLGPEDGEGDHDADGLEYAGFAST